jgi:hypothetical protein
MGFQPDVFDSSPAKGFYSPLRRIHFVTLIAGEPKILESEAEIREAEARGGVGVERTTFVVNMPFLTWPGALKRRVCRDKAMARAGVAEGSHGTQTVLTRPISNANG